MCSKNGGIFKSWEATVRKKQAAAKKRVLSNLFLTMSVASVDDDMSTVSGADTISQSERVFPNGDFYTGQCSSDNVPHGHGKYLWTDGCMYVGEWHRGRATGKGKFFWPSGATYEGHFKSGFMDGQGNYTEPSGNMYRGNWVMNLKQGQGTKNYLNGDYYEGEWKGGLQDGQGKYQWNNGNNYVGEWKDGKMNGTGTLTWTNGNRYEGLWEDGVPKGNGTFTNTAAGGSYVGFWSKESSEMSVTYQPVSESSSSSSSASSENINNDMEGWDPQQLYDVELQSCIISPGEKQPMLLSQKMPTWPADLENVSRRPRRSRTTQEGRLSNFSADSDNSVTYESMDPAIITRSIAVARQFLRVRPAKRQGETISKGHKNYELMLNLQLGIRHSVGKHPPPKSLDLKSSSFDPKEKVWTKFPPEGSKSTPPHQSCEFRWKDYCPLVFRTLRLLFKVDPADYMLSICGNEALRELSSPGKSGSFFYMTSDDRYMIKTVKKAEVKVLIRMLKEYYNHVRSFDNTLVTKFFGLHCVKLPGPSQKKVRFVIMGNLFDSGYAIHRRFDLKGSSHGRITDKPESEIDANTTLKDLDLNFIFRLQPSRFQELCKQVDKDCEFLEKARIMDYSLLIGLHFRNVTYNNDTQINEACPCSAIQDNNDSDGSSSPCLSSSDPEQSPSALPRWEMKMGLNMPARAELTVRRSDGESSQLVGEPTGELYQVILTFGIIDILQDYDITKKIEHAYKSIQYDPTSISAVDPKQYSKRFRDFIYRVFVEDT